MTAEMYIGRVLDVLPKATPRREQIATELRGHIAERTAAGQAEADVLRQLGDPVTLAESYLSAVPLVSASFVSRAAAKLLDLVTLALFIVPLGVVLLTALPNEYADFMVPLAILAAIVGGSMSFAIYSVVSESVLGYTLGKRALGLRVVRESGARISIGQSIVRQLPLFFQVFWIDALFALFTEKSQRAFEMLSKTRVVKNWVIE